MHSHKAITKYLQRYAEANSDLSAELKTCKSTPFDQAVIIPACNESPEFLSRIVALPSPGTTLWVVVLNAPENPDEEHLSSSQACLEWLRTHCDQWQQLNNISGIYSKGQHWICCLDLVQNPCSPWPCHGVGFARKLAMDLCLWLYHHGHLLMPFVRSTDADIQWPDQYLEPLPTPPALPQPEANVSAFVYPFEHGPVNKQDPSHSDAALIYDAWLRYYVKGLGWANCPWSFHTIGSTLAINLHHYAINRGFPKKEAAEDFYLLNKLAKTGSIIQLDSPKLRLSNRISQRTPFGTGRSIHTMASTQLENWRFYHPDVFNQVKYWYQYQSRQYQKEMLDLPAEAEPLRQVLRQLGIEKHLKHCSRVSQDSKGFNNQLNLKIDAALVRKCVHLLRDQYYGSVSYLQLLDLIDSGAVPFIAQGCSSHNDNHVLRLTHYLNKELSKF